LAYVNGDYEFWNLNEDENPVYGNFDVVLGAVLRVALGHTTPTRAA